MQLKPDKHQHFLENKNILALEIKTAQLKNTDNVIEIGAGDGRLTKLIASKVEKLTAFETDTQFQENLTNIPRAKIIFDNALKYNWQGHNKIVANIPYSLSEPILLKSIKENIEELTLIIGDKFAQLLNTQETKIGIIANLHFNIKLIKPVPKDEFTPPPRVDSYLIQLKRKTPNKKEQFLIDVINKKGKTKNAILFALLNQGLTKNQGREKIKTLNLNDKTLEKPTTSLTGAVLKKLKTLIVS